MDKDHYYSEPFIQPKDNFKRNITILSILAVIGLIFIYLFIKESWLASLYASDYSWLNQFLK